MSGPLDGIRVVDFTQGWAGPFCTMELGDLGADVIKVEPMEGDLTRRLGPPAFAGESLPFLALNRSKRSIVIDVARREGVEIVQRLVADAHVVVESAQPGAMDALGIGYDALCEHAPALVYGTITGFGQSGPYRDWACSELVAQAMGGMVTYDDHGDPLAIGGDQLSLFAGKFLFHGLTAALFHRLRTGEGQRVDVSMLESALARSMALWPPADTPVATPTSTRPPIWASAPRQFATADMPVEFNFRINGYTPDDEAWMTFFRRVGADELARDPRFATEAGRSEHFAALRPLLEKHLATWTGEALLALVLELGAMAAPWHTLDGALAHPQAQALNMTATVEHATLGPLRMTDSPYDFLGSPAAITLAPPTLGQHTIEILHDIGYDEGAIVGLLEAEVMG